MDQEKTDDGEQRDVYLEHVMKLRERTRKAELERTHPVAPPPCRKCGHGRPPKDGLSVFAYKEFLPLIEQRFDGGLCVECATTEVNDLYHQGKLGSVGVVDVPNDEEDLYGVQEK